VALAEVGVEDPGADEIGARRGFDEAGVDAHGQVPPHPRLAPVEDRAQVQEVLEDAEVGFDLLAGAVGVHHPGGGGDAAVQGGRDHVAAGEELFVVERGLVAPLAV
jgi:hypothetical protein